MLCAPRGACCVQLAISPVDPPQFQPFCFFITAAECANRNGHFLGVGVPCTDNTCEPRGACCRRLTDDDGNVTTQCAVVRRSQCLAAGGVFLGVNTVCSPDLVCPEPPTGACCVQTGAQGLVCIITTRQQCHFHGGRFKGPDTDCDGPHPCRRCPCDWNDDGVLDHNDLIAFVNDYLAGVADFNGDGTTDQSDLAEFMSCFQTPPPVCRPGPTPIDPTDPPTVLDPDWETVDPADRTREVPTPERLSKPAEKPLPERTR